MTQVRYFRKKPVVVKAMKWDGSTQSATHVIDWIIAGDGTAHYHDMDDPGELYSWIEIDTLEGSMKARPGDWVIQGIKGEFYPHDGSFFKQAYDEVFVTPDDLEGVPA